MEYKDRLRKARKHARLTQKELAKIVKIDQTSISDLERGKSQSSSYSASLATACGVSPLWLENEIGEMLVGSPSPLWPAEGEGKELHGLSNVLPALNPHREATEYPLISWVAAGGWMESCDNFSPGDADEWIASEENAGVNAYWLEVKGKSMFDPSGQAPISFPPGHRILVKPEGFDVISGKFYIARLRDAKGGWETTFKQYVRDAGIEYLQPINPSFETLRVDDHVEIIGRVIDSRPPKALF